MMSSNSSASSGASTRDALDYSHRHQKAVERSRREYLMRVEIIVLADTELRAGLRPEIE